MEKRSLRPLTRRWITGGVGLGAATSAAMGLVRMLREGPAVPRSSGETDEDTIVLELPRKIAAVAKAKGLPVKVMETNAPKTSEFSGYKNQPRRADGTVGETTMPRSEMPKTAAGWRDILEAWLGGGAGFLGGYALMNRWDDKRREQRMERALAESRREYLDKLQRPADVAAEEAKVAEVVDMFLPTTLEPGEKQAANLSSILAAMALIPIVSATGVGLLGKKVLDERAREDEDEGFEPPKVRRVLFKGALAPEADVGDPCDDNDTEFLKASLCVVMDALDPKHVIGSSAAVKTAASSAGVSIADLHAATEQPLEKLAELLTPEASAGLRGAYVDASIEKYSMLRHFGWEKKSILGSILASTIGSELSSQDMPRDLTKAIIDAQRVTQTDDDDEPRLSRIKVEAQGPGAEEFLSNNKDRVHAILKRLAAQKKL